MHPSLTERYKLELAPMTVAGKGLEIYRIADLGPILRRLNEEEDGEIRGFPFWVKVWEAAFILTGHLLRMDLNPQTAILEIGAGMGIAGLFLASAGYSVTVTDSDDDALELLRMNAEHNGLETLCIEKLDWADPALEGTFDVICGSELIYSKSTINPVIQLLHTYLKPEGTVLMAHDINRQWLTRFMDKAQETFDVGHRVNTIRSDTETYRILVSRLRLKSSE